MEFILNLLCFLASVQSSRNSELTIAKSEKLAHGWKCVNYWSNARLQNALFLDNETQPKELVFTLVNAKVSITFYRYL